MGTGREARLSGYFEESSAVQDMNRVVLRSRRICVGGSDFGAMVRMLNDFQNLLVPFKGKSASNQFIRSDHVKRN